MALVHETGEFTCDCGSAFGFLPEEPQDGHSREFIHTDCPTAADPPTSTSYGNGHNRHHVVSTDAVTAHYAAKGKSFPAPNPHLALDPRANDAPRRPQPPAPGTGATPATAVTGY